MSEYDLNNPQSDVESYLANMDGILAPLPLPPESNVEKYLAHIVGVQGVELPNKPDSRVEAYLEKLALDPPQPVTPILIEKQITNNGVYSAGDDNADGYSKVTVEVPDPVLDDITITENGVYTSEHDGFDEVTVEVQPPENSYQLKSITTPTPLATFEASNLPMPSLKVSVESQQDLHGYDKPWVGGAGKNKYDKNNANNQPNKRVSTGSGGTYAADGYTATYLVEVKPDTDYTLTTSSNFVSYICWYDENQTQIGGTNWSSGTSKTSPSNAKYVRFDFSTADIDKVQLEQGDTATSYEPYSNICPISGWDEVEVSDVGKNKWAAGETFSKDNSATYTPKVFTLAAGTYTISGLFTTTSPDNKVRFSFRTSSPVTVALEANVSSRTSATFTLTEQCETIRVYGQDNTSDTYSATYTDVMVESGETATSFEPYVEPNLYTISLGQTVYCGELDVVNGTSGNKLTHGFRKGFTRGALDSSGKLYKLSPILDDGAVWTDAANASTKISSNMFEVLSLRDARTATTPSISQYDTGLYVGGYVGDEATLDALLSNLQVKYELATPTTFTTQPTPIKSLNGTNNLSVDCGDVIEGEYFKAL